MHQEKTILLKHFTLSVIKYFFSSFIKFLIHLSDILTCFFTGVTLKSPTQHQKELLAWLKPKSPMKLRHRTLSRTSTSSTSSSTKSKTIRKVLTSPNHTITTFFKKTDESDNTISSDEFQNCSTSSADTLCSSTDEQKRTRRNNRNNSTISTSSSTITQRGLNDSGDANSTLESDQELAERLQKEYDQEWQKNSRNNNNNLRTPIGKKKPLQVRSKNFIIDVDNSPPLPTQLGDNKHHNNNISVLVEDHSRKKKKKKNS